MVLNLCFEYLQLLFLSSTERERAEGQLIGSLQKETVISRSNPTAFFWFLMYFLHILEYEKNILDTYGTQIAYGKKTFTNEIGTGNQCTIAKPFGQISSANTASPFLNFPT
jgi:hypothetical protein